MPTFAIPEHQQSALIRIRELSDGAFDQFIRALENVEPTAKSADLFENVKRQAPDLMAIEDLRSALSTLYSLYNLRAMVDVSSTHFIRDLLRAIQDSGNEHLKFSDTEKGAFEERLVRLMDIGPLNLSSKAFMLQREHEHLFHDVQLFTDLRPVFGANPSEEPIGMVLAYTLKVVYHGARQHEELYIALDSDDVAKLKSVIERAETKAETLKRLLSAKQIRPMAQ